MFCPRCASEQSDELKFCKSCGANLYAVRQALTAREPDQAFDWSKTWVADMFLSPAELKRRKEELERQRGITPDVKRRIEIKAGVITTSVGIGVAIFLYFLMQGIILSGKVQPGVEEILSRVWIAGIIPMLVGIALIVNGVLVSKKSGPETFGDSSSQPVSDTNELPRSGFSVTEGTTEHLGRPEQEQRQ